MRRNFSNIKPCIEARHPSNLLKFEIFHCSESEMLMIHTEIVSFVKNNNNNEAAPGGRGNAETFPVRGKPPEIGKIVAENGCYLPAVYSFKEDA